ncbi:MAG: S9 family peptidase [Acidobacteriia bacterium]|nr:S9 family peptidase [Terriglobia bacterium]
MKEHVCMTVLGACLLCFFNAAAATGPDDRAATDPQSLTSPESPNPQPVPIADFFYSHTAFSPALSPDGKQVVFTTDVTGRFNLWRTEVDGSMPIQLLRSDEAQDTPVWSPDGKWIVFRQDTGGNELYDLYAVPGDGGAVLNLTKTADVSEDSALFSPDGRLLAITIKPKESATSDVAVMDWRTHGIRKLTHEQSHDHLWQIFGWSKDGKYVFANRVKESYTDSEIYRVDVAEGIARNLTPHTGEVMYTGTSVSPTGEVLFNSNAKGGYQNVGVLHVDGGTIEWITDTRWEATAGNFSPDGRYFTYQMNQDGRTDLYLQDTRSRVTHKLAFPEGISSDVGSPTSFSSDGARLLVYHEDSQRPPDLWVYDLRTQKAKQLTHSALASLRPASIPPSQLVHYKSFDGTMISAYVWMPFNTKRDRSSPVVVLPHGGPTGQTMDKFNTVAAALASRGFICISPNVRGSTGYGMAFQKANVKDLGGGDLQDEIYATKFLVATGYADPRKIGITGESYGGYVTLLAISKTPEVWSAAASEYGIVDWRSLLQHTDPRLQEYVKSLLGDPVADHKVYEEASPITYLHQVKAPLLLLQGENDPRVPKEEAQQVFDALKAAGNTVELHYYPQEGHGFEKSRTGSMLCFASCSGSISI